MCELRAMVSQQAQEITGLQSTVRSMKTEVDNIKDTVQTLKHKLNVSHHSPFILLPLIHPPTFCHRNLQPYTLLHVPLSHQPHQVQVKPLHLLSHPLLNHQLFLVPLFLSLLLTNIPLLLGCPQLPTLGDPQG